MDKNLAKTCTFWPKWQIFAKSGHTAVYLPNTDHCAWKHKT